MKEKMKTLKKKICAAGIVIAAAGISVPAAIGTLSAEPVYADNDFYMRSEFPDENFRNFVLENFDTNKDGILDDREKWAVTEIDCQYEDIDDFTGVEQFPNLEYFDCSGNTLYDKALDLSKNTKLIEIQANNCFLKGGINVSGCEKLEELWLINQQLPSLDVTKNTELRELLCSGYWLNSRGELTELDVSNNKELYWLDCATNKITSLNLKNNSNLYRLDASDNEIEKIDLLRDYMEDVDLSNNPLKTLNINTSHIGSLRFGGNDLKISAPSQVNVDSLRCSIYFMMNQDANKINVTRELIFSLFDPITPIEKDISRHISRVTKYIENITGENDPQVMETTNAEKEDDNTLIVENEEIEYIYGKIVTEENYYGEKIDYLKRIGPNVKIICDNYWLDEKKEFKKCYYPVTLKMSIDQGEVESVEGVGLMLEAILSPANIDADITWSSSDENVATVQGYINNYGEQAGDVECLKPGTATITVKAVYGDKTLSATAKITVKPKVKDLVLDKTDIQLSQGNTVKLNATVSPSDAMYKDVYWISSDYNVATVDNDGVVK